MTSIVPAPLAEAMAEIEAMVLVVTEVLAEEGIQPDQEVIDYSAKFVFTHLSAAARRRVDIEISSGRAGSLKDRLRDTLLERRTINMVHILRL